MDEQRPPLASVDQVREELRRLGYLDRGLDRFVLAAARSATTTAASARAAWRVGLASGVLLALAVTVAAVGLDRRLLAEPQDLAVLGLYVALVLGLAATATAFVLGAVAGLVARKRGRGPGPALPRSVAVVFGLVGFVYLALWWRSRAAEAPLPAQAAALAVGLGLSLVLGRFGWLAAVVVLSTGGPEAHLPQARLSRRHVAPFLGATALLLALGVGGSWLSEKAGREAPAFAVVPTGLRVRVVGIDGLERGMMSQRLAAGEMPHLAALLAGAARARLRVEPERVPAIVWTTIATGRGPEAHGIQSTGTRRLFGMRTPLAAAESPLTERLGAATDLLRITRSAPPSSALRGAKAFWNVASEKGLRVGVVNWWATWPCDPVNGYVVTDRAFLRVDRGGAPDREACPVDVFDSLRALAPPPGTDRARALDGFYGDAARLLRDGSPADIEAVYLPGLDIATTQQLGEAPTADLASLDTRLGVVRDYHRFLDDRIGALTDDLSPRDVLVLVADPGRLARGGPSPEGTLALVGAVVAPQDLGRASERDVAPTVLHLAGLPVSRELSGQVLEAALQEVFRKSHAVRFVASYGRRAAARAAESAFDHDVLEELRALGYIQ
jgi:Type I phosphodiesterase / nucleotide pyrophosphatase